MLCYDVSNYDCCGMICINHDDNLLEKKIFINQSHLTRIKHNSWKCCCISICSGKQNYCTQKTTQISYFRIQHDGKAPWRFLNITEENPNASICDFCYKDVADDNDK